MSSFGVFYRLCFDYFSFSLILKGFNIGQHSSQIYKISTHLDRSRGKDTFLVIGRSQVRADTYDKFGAECCSGADRTVRAH